MTRTLPPTPRYSSGTPKDHVPMVSLDADEVLARITAEAWMPDYRNTAPLGHSSIALNWDETPGDVVGYRNNGDRELVLYNGTFDLDPFYDN